MIPRLRCADGVQYSTRANRIGKIFEAAVLGTVFSWPERWKITVKRSVEYVMVGNIALDRMIP